MVAASTGCAVFGPPGPAERSNAPAPIADGPPAYVPATWAADVDRQGPPPLNRDLEADDQTELMPDDIEEDDAVLLDGRPVEPILAMTGTVSFDIPYTENERVQMWMDFLTGRGRESFGRWLARSTRYVPVYLPILAQYDLPQDLVFLSMIESGFSPRAYSWAHAAGPWQFMPATGRRFGLKVGFWVDERRDFVKSTHAAAQYLSRLRDKFGHWYLAFAAYNAGPGRVSRAIRRVGSEDFWRISRTRRLKRETKHYVPKLLAAARLGKEPSAFGFGEVKYLPPLKWEELKVELATDLKTLAAACGLEGIEPLELLNPELRCGVTPPGQAYPLRVPPGTAATCSAGLQALSPNERFTYRYHEMAPKDDLQKLARLYTTTATAILTFNEIKPKQLREYGEIVIPVKVADAARLAIKSPPQRRFRPSRYGPSGTRIIVHRVRSGDSLWRIARRYRVSIRKIRLWNGLWKTSTLRIGQQIKIHARQAGVPGRGGRRARAARGASGSRYRVRSGDSLWSIAVRYGTSVDRLCRLNGIDRTDKLQIGQVLRVR